MSDTPHVTITDPQDPTPARDVLTAGGDRPERKIPKRLVGGLALLAVLAAGGTAGTRAYLDHRAEQRRQAAAFAVADTVHVRLDLDPDGLVASLPEGVRVPNLRQVVTGRPALGRVSIPLLDRENPAGFEQITGATLEGSTLRYTFNPTDFSPRAPGGAPTPLMLNTSLDCAPVAAGRYPTLGTAVVTVVPSSGRTHRLTVPLTSKSTPKDLALQACGLPDPDGVPAVSIEGQHGMFLLDVTSLERSRDVLRIVRITARGFAIAQRTGGGRPESIGSNTSALLDVTAQVTDCKTAQEQPLAVTVVLTNGTRTWTVLAKDLTPTSYRVPGTAILQSLLDRSCP